jgi:RHS repeat-associated protein
VPFGEKSPVTAGNPLAYNGRFPGQSYDTETGLHYNGFRDYDPGSGRYVESDPIGLAGGINIYTYGLNNPLFWFDLSGMVPGDAYITQHEAAEAALNEVNPLSILNNVEYGGMIYQNSKGEYFYTSPQRGDSGSVNPGGPSACPSNTTATAYYHTHGAYDPNRGNENFSSQDSNGDGVLDGDIPWADYNGIDAYLGTPGGNLKYYNHSDGQQGSIGSVNTK